MRSTRKKGEIGIFFGTDTDRIRLVVILRHAELDRLHSHVYLHCQRNGTYGTLYEYPYPSQGIQESEGNLPVPKVLASLALHFDA